jgi:hypothetical protein
VVEAAPNYGEEWSGNYELRRFGGAEKGKRWRGSSFFMIGIIANREEEH